MRPQPLALILALVIVLGGGLLVSQGWLRERAFDLTGEADPGPQALGMAQLALNLTTRPLDTRPNASIDHSGVNPFGINTFLQQEVDPSRREEQLRLISEAGFHWIRQEFSWQDIEVHGRGDFVDRRNDPNGVDAWAKYDNIVDLADKHGLEIIARLSSPPAWSRAAGETNGAFAPPDDYEDFARYAQAVVKRYKGRIHYYQVWNEPNIYPEWGEQNVSPEDYTKLLCLAYQAIKTADPEAVVLSGALAPTAELSGRDFSDYLFLDRMYRAGAGACFDILSMQGYGLWSGPTDHRMRPLVVNYSRNEFIRDLMVKHGDEHKPIWISEMNWNVAPEGVEPRYGRVTLDQQARWAPLAYERAQQEWPWVGVISLWYFKRADDQWLRERRPEAYFQMAEPDFTLLPVYESMKAYANQWPVIYSGNHAADHWAIVYGSAWQVDNGVAKFTQQGPGETGNVLFSFEGTTLRIEFGPDDAPESDVILSVDGGAPTGFGSNKGYFVWKGWWGQHTVSLIPAPNGKINIQRIKVGNELPLILQMVLSAMAILGGALYALSRKLPGAPSKSLPKGRAQ